MPFGASALFTLAYYLDKLYRHDWIPIVRIICKYRKQGILILLRSQTPLHE